MYPQEWWGPVIGFDQVEPPGPGKLLTVIDTGVDLTHPEFAGRPNTTALNSQSTFGQSEEHGTAVASVAAAPVNAIGLAGVNPGAALQVWDASPTGNGITAGDVVQGLQAAITSGAGVVNLSLGSTSKNTLLDSMIEVTFANGILVVAAAGNSKQEGSPLEYPASLPHVITAGATQDANNTPAFFSSGSQFVDLAAPGYNIPVAVPTTFVAQGYAVFAGTSFASPLVAGSAAWVWTARPTLDVTQLFSVMRLSAIDISSPGFDPFTGFGLLSIPRALTVAPLPIDPQEPNEDVTYLKKSGLLHRASPVLRKGSISARLERSEDPRDVYRVWIPGKRTGVITLKPSGGDVDLAMWGPSTASVLEGGSARRRDFRGISERLGSKAEVVRVKNKNRRGAYYYAEAYVGSGNGSVVRKPAGVGYKLTVTNVKPKKKPARR
jgi:hypothetical protein